jgi:hypothetical protein
MRRYNSLVDAARDIAPDMQGPCSVLVHHPLIGADAGYSWQGDALYDTSGRLMFTNRLGRWELAVMFKPCVINAANTEQT